MLKTDSDARARVLDLCPVVASPETLLGLGGSVLREFIDLAYRATLDDLRDPDVQISLGLGLEPAASIYANIYNSQPTSER